MTTPEQIASNRRNAQKSTGPRTEEGRALSSRNAVRHGLTSTHIIAVGESASDYEAFADSLMDSLNPEGPLEEALAERIATCAWRLRRVARLESTHAEYVVGRTARELKEGFAGWATGLTPRGVEGRKVPERAEVLTTLSRYEAALERSMYRAMHELERLQTRRGGGAVEPPQVVDVDVSVATGAADDFQ